MYVSRNGIAESYDDSVFNFLRNCILFSMVAAPVCSPTNLLNKYSNFSTLLPTFVILSLSLFFGSHIDGCKGDLNVLFSFGYATGGS